MDNEQIIAESKEAFKVLSMPELYHHNIDLAKSVLLRISTELEQREESTKKPLAKVIPLFPNFIIIS